ncbi:hypothetical protein DFH08DRAFT_979473 [Mycena albidolilacea]|uniref:Uncharacterized protein n=1 Tax=Mycena albidolilacea TaxID=1033008 RepID=A0AAD7E6A6_9AGAR|nr:hypothetical protein DFH08DRAFT_979473 [Mycena albidolilacea]
MHLRYQIYAQLMLYTLGIFFVFACERHLSSVTLAPQSKVTHKIASFGRWEYCQEALLPPSPPSPVLPAAYGVACMYTSAPLRSPHLPSFLCRPSSRHPIVSSACFSWTPAPSPFSVHLYGAIAAPTLAFGDSVFTHYPLFLACTARSLPATWPIPRSLDLNALLFSCVFFPPRVALR